jgi:hypothetical protein
VALLEAERFTRLACGLSNPECAGLTRTRRVVHCVDIAGYETKSILPSVTAGHALSL